MNTPPLPLPTNWVDYVNEPQSLEELAELRAAVSRERPYGGADWVTATARSLGFTYSITPRGRPRKRVLSVESASQLDTEAFEK